MRARRPSAARHRPCGIGLPPPRPMLGADVHESSRNASTSANVRCTMISLVSTDLRPAVCPQLAQGARSATRRARGGPQRLQCRARAFRRRIGSSGNPPPEHVPGIGGDRSAGAHHARHFGDALRRLGNEEDHQGHDRRVESGSRRTAAPSRRPAEIRAIRACDAGRAKASCPSDGSRPCTSVGAQRSINSSVKAPLPQPTSIAAQARKAASSQSRNTSPARPAPHAHHALVGSAVCRIGFAVQP